MCHPGPAAPAARSRRRGSSGCAVYSRCGARFSPRSVRTGPPPGGPSSPLQGPPAAPVPRSPARSQDHRATALVPPRPAHYHCPRPSSFPPRIAVPTPLLSWRTVAAPVTRSRLPIYRTIRTQPKPLVEINRKGLGLWYTGGRSGTCEVVVGIENDVAVALYQAVSDQVWISFG